MINTTNLYRGLAILGIAALITGCSAESQRLSRAKSEVDAEKTAQKALIDDRSAELKRNIDLNLKRSDDQIATEKSMKGADQKSLDATKATLERNAKEAKANIDEQTKECKRTVDRNATNLEAELDKGKYQ